MLSHGHSCTEQPHEPQLPMSKTIPLGNCRALRKTYTAGVLASRNSMAEKALLTMQNLPLPRGTHNNPREAIVSASPCCSRYLCDGVTHQGHSRMDLRVSGEQPNWGNCDTPQASSSAKCCKILLLPRSLWKGVYSFQFALRSPADKKKMLPSKLISRNTSIFNRSFSSSNN